MAVKKFVFRLDRAGRMAAGMKKTFGYFWPNLHPHFDRKKP